MLLFDSALQLRLIPPTEMLVRCHGYHINGSHQRDEASAFGCELDCFGEERGEAGHFERLEFTEDACGSGRLKAEEV